MEISGLTLEMLREILLTLGSSWTTKKATIDIRQVIRLDEETWLIIYLYSQEYSGEVKTERRVKMWSTNKNRTLWDMIA